jgi:hypothetical protein
MSLNSSGTWDKWNREATMNSPLLSVLNGSYLNGPAHRSSRSRKFLAYASFSKKLDRQPLRLYKPTPGAALDSMLGSNILRILIVR